MTEYHRNPWHHIAVAVLKSCVVLFIGGVLLHWSWSTLGELFGFPNIQFKHTLASELLIAVVVAIGVLSGRLVAGRLFAQKGSNAK